MAKKKSLNISPLYNDATNRVSLLANFIPGNRLNISDLDKYNYRLAPDNYDGIDWTKDAYTDWMITRDKTNLDTSQGKLDRSLLDADVLDKSEQYLSLLRKKDELEVQAGSGSISREELTQQLNLIYSTIEQQGLQDAYNKLSTGDLAVLKNEIDVNFSKRGLDQQYDQLKRYRELLEEFQNKSQEDVDYYTDKVNRTHDYWWTNTHEISDYYKNKQLATDFDFGNIDTYLYKVPNLLGSSASSMKSLVVGTVAAAIAANAPHPLVKLGAALVSIGSNLYSRNEESYAELHQNYRDKLRRVSEKDGSLDVALKNARKQLAQQGITEADDETVLDAIVRGQVKSGSEKFDNNIVKSLNGMESLYTDNMALSGWDVAEQAIEVMPYGTFAKAAKGTKTLAKKIKGVEWTGNKLRGFKKQLADRIDDVVTFGMDNVSSLPKRTMLRNLASLGGRVVLTSALEGAEEGTQYIRGQEYINEEYETNPNVFKSILRGFESGARSVFAAVTPWDPVYSSDKEFLENFKGGALLGGLTTSVVTPISQWKSLSNKLKADELVSSLYADAVELKDRVLKDASYTKAAKTQNWENVNQAFEDLKLTDIEGVSELDIDEEAKRAEAVRNLALSESMLKEAISMGIDPRSDDYDAFVALRLHADNMLRDASRALDEASNKVKSILTNDQHDTWYSEQEASKKVNNYDYNDLVAAKAKKIAIERRLKDLEGLPTVEDIVKEINAIDKENTKYYNDLLSTLGLTDEKVDAPYILSSLTDESYNALLLEVDKKLAEKEYKIFRDSNAKEVKKRINKYKGVVEEDQNLVQELLDQARGNTQSEDVEIEIKPEELAPVTEPIESTITNEDGTKEEVKEPIKEQISDKPDRSTMKGHKLIKKYIRLIQETDDLAKKVNASYMVLDQFNRAKEYDQNFYLTDEEQNILDDVFSEMNKRGWEIASLIAIGKRYDPGYKIYVERAAINEDLPYGSYVISNVVRPQINENGIMIQAAKIYIEFNETPPEQSLLNKLRKEILKERAKKVQVTTKSQPKSRRQLELTRTRLNLNKLSNYQELTPTQRWIEAEQLAHDDNSYTNDELSQLPDHIFTDNELGKAYGLAKTTLETYGNKLAPDVAKDLMDQLEKLPQASRKNVSWKYYDKNGNFNYLYNEDFFYSDLDASELDNFYADSWLDLKQLKDRLEEAIFNNDITTATDLAKQIEDKVQEMNSNEDNLIQKEQEDAPTVQEQENAKKLDTVPQIEPEVPITSESEDVVDDNIDITYDRTIDPISHNIDYYTYNSNTEAREFAEVSANEDFIMSSDISINVEGDNIDVVFNYKGKEYKARVRSAQDLLKDYSFRKKSFDQQTIIKSNLNRFRNKILNLSVLAKKNNSRIIPLGISRTNGIIRNKTNNGAPVNVNLQDTPLWKLSDVYDITPDNTKIGVSTGAIRNNKVRRGNEQWTAKGTSMGSAIWHVEINHPEDGSTRSIDIQLNNKPFKGNKEVADLIVDLLLSTDLYYATKQGVATPFTPMLLLNLIVNNGPQTIVQEKESNKLNADQLNAKKAKQLSILDNNRILVGDKVYDISELLSNKDAKNEVSQYIQDNMHWNIDEDLLYKYFGGINTFDSNHPLNNLKGWFKRTKADKLTVIPGQLEFNRKDVGLDDSTPTGISMLGWYIKNNIVQTDFDKLTDASIYIQDVTLEDTQTKQEVQEATQKVIEEQAKPTEELELTLDDYFKMLGPSDYAANYTTDELLGEKKTIDIESAKQWLTKNLGLSDEQVETKDAILGLSRTNMLILGQSKIDSIVLSELAPEGVQYHEAWHRVSNLLMSDARRTKLYRKYRQKYNIAPTVTNTRIDEMMANDFMEFLLEKGMKIDFETTNWFKKILNFVKVWSKVSDYQLAKLYTQMNTGTFAKVKVDEANIKRFKNLYGDAGAPFEIRGLKFQHIPSILQYNYFLDLLVFITIDVSNVHEYSDVNAIDLNVVKNILVNKDGNSKNPAWKELYEKFDTVVAKDLKLKLKNLQIKVINKTRDELTNSIDAGEVEGVNVGEHTIASYESSAYDNAPAEVKFFFQTIPAHIYNEDGKKVLDMDPTIRIPKFVDPKVTWNTVLNDLHEITSVRNMIDRINTLANENLLYSGVKAKIDQLLLKAKSDDKKVATDADALLTKLYTVIRSHKHIFTTGKITQTLNGNIIDIIDNTVDVKSKAYPSIWSQLLFSSRSIFTHDANGNVTFAKDGKHAIDVILRNYKYVQDAFKNNGVSKKGVDLKEGAAFEQLKLFTALLLNNAGILVDKGTIETLINRPEYGGINDTQYDRLNKFYNSTPLYGGMPSLMELLSSVKTLEKDGKINTFENNGKEIRPIEIYNNNGFVKEVAKAYVEFHSNSEELRSLGAQGNLYYPISQNNFASDRVNELNTDLELVSNLRKVVYNRGSRILELLTDPKTKLSLETFVNFRTDSSNDLGRDYFGITDKEDYISKMTMILNDRILFPTIADKKTYHTIRGIKLPHERLQFINNTKAGDLVRFGEGTINQFIDYANAERDAIELCMRQVDDTVDENGNYVSKDRIEPSQRIKNYHTPNRYKGADGKWHTVEPNGTRFRFLTGVYKYIAKESNGLTLISKQFVSFNDPTKSSAENLKVAYDNFFGDHITDDQRRWMLDTLLQERVDAEINRAVDLGLISSVTSRNTTYGLRNKLLDVREVDSRSKYYAKNDKLNANAEGYAIYDMIADYTVNSIISINEIEQLFSGDPAYYKIAYDRHGITDISIDKIKRLGALTSTGTNNRLDFEDNFATSYTVAELKDYEIGSKIYPTIKELFIRGNVKSAVKLMRGEEALFDSDGRQYTIDELIEKYPEEYKWAQKAGEKQAGYDEGINVADAAVYVSPNMYRKMMRMIGEWDAEVEEAFNILTDPNTQDWESNPELYSKMLHASLKPLKYMAFGTRFNEVEGLGIPYFNKMALFPLFKLVATGDMKALYDRMTDPKNPLDMVMFNSAVKAGSRAAMNYYTPVEKTLKLDQTILDADQMDAIESNDGNVISNLNDLVVYNLEFKYLRQQLNTNPHTHEELMAGTLMLKVGLSNLGMNEMYGNEDSKVSGSFIKNEVFSCMNALSEKGKQQIYDALFDENGSVSIEKLGRMLQEEAEGQDANDNIISGLQVKDGKFVIPISALSDNKWLESIFVSYINKRTIDIDLPGGAFIQRSTFGLEATLQSVITDNMLNNGKRLNLINDIFTEVKEKYGEDSIYKNVQSKLLYSKKELIEQYPELYDKVKNIEGSMDSIVSINLLKHIIPNYKKMTFTQARQWLIDHNIIGDNAEPNAIGYRIPTQSQASISALRFTDVLPEIMGDTIVLPEEFTKLTGSDFDVDKLYVSRYAYENGQKVKFDDSLSHLENSSNAVKNRLIEMYLKVLTTIDNTNALKLSIDNDTEMVKDVLKDIESAKDVHYVTPFEVYSPSYQEDRKAEYTGGKAGIGPMALNNAHQVLTLLMHTKMESTPFTNALKLRDLGRIYDYPTANGNNGRILSWLSAMINAFVDIAKDPYIVRLNVNPWTYNMTAFLLRTGKGRLTFYFLSQPILKEISSEVLKTKGKYGVDQTKTPSQLEQEAIEKVLTKYDPNGKLRKYYDGVLKDDSLKASEFGDLFDTYMTKDEKGNLIETSRTRKLIINPDNVKDMNKEQVRIYYAWKALKPYADDMANLVKYSKIDTKRMGKSFAEQRVFDRGLQDMKETSRFGEGEVSRFFNDSFLEVKRQNSIELGQHIFHNLLIRNSDGFLATQDMILKRLGRSNNASSDLLNRVINTMEAYVKSDFFNHRIEEDGVNILDMFYGQNSMARRLLAITNDIYKGKYQDLLGADGNISNGLLTYLIPNITNYSPDFKVPDFIDTSSMFDADQLGQNNLINYWRELLEHPDNTIKTFARDLIYYAFVTSGDNTNMNSFFKYVPNSWRIESGYADFMENQLQNYNMGSSTINYRDVFLNNWYDDTIVKPVKDTVTIQVKGEDGQYIDSETTFIGIEANFTFPGTLRKPLATFIGRMYDDYKHAGDVKAVGYYKRLEWSDSLSQMVQRSYPIFPPFVKIRMSKGNSPLNFAVYELVGYQEEFNKKTGRVNYYPVYSIVNKKGLRYRGHVITELGRDDNYTFNFLPTYNAKQAIKDGSIVEDAVNSVKDDYQKQMMRERFSNVKPIDQLPSYQDLSNSDNYDISDEDTSIENAPETTLTNSIFLKPKSDQVEIEDKNKPWKSDPFRVNKTRIVYLKNLRNKGYFELVKDEEDNYYSVHFKPEDKNNPNAFSKEEKLVLFLALADMIPGGAFVSTWGEISKGGVSGLNRFSNLGFTKVGERDIKTKSGEDIKIPIYQKNDVYENTFDKEKQDDNYSDEAFNACKG